MSRELCRRLRVLESARPARARAMRDLSGFTDDELIVIVDARDVDFDLSRLGAEREGFALATIAKLESAYFAQSADTPSANRKAQCASVGQFPHRDNHHSAAHAVEQLGNRSAL